MGEQQFICPECDHLDVVMGECPDCGGTLQKFSPETEMIEQDGLEDEFGYSAGGDLDDFDDEEGLEPHEGGLQTTY